MNPCSGAQVQETAASAARHSYGKLVAFLAARSGNLAAAEDALSEAFAAALEDWPAKGCPANPEAWLLTVARRKLIDSSRRRKNEAPEEYELA
ncbi:MAG TPA: sigma factor, partial [Terracidiphilus sp.]